MFGLDISFDADARIKHLQFKAEHGYYIPDDYYKLISQDYVEEIKQTSNKKGAENLKNKKQNVIENEQIKPENNKPSLTEINEKPISVSKQKETKEKEINENSWLDKVKVKKFKFRINPAIISFLIPIVISFLVFLGYECGLFKNSAVSSIFNKVHFEGGYAHSVGKWLDGVDDWFRGTDNVGNYRWVACFCSVYSCKDNCWYYRYCLVVNFLDYHRSYKSSFIYLYEDNVYYSIFVVWSRCGNYIFNI